MTLELSVTDLKFGKGVGSSRGRYCPFVQLSDAKGHVIGRSRVVFDCLVHATWPCITMNWDVIVQLHRQQLPEYPPQDLAGWVYQQPVLVALYDYQSDGNHVLLGKLVTCFSEIFTKALEYDTKTKTKAASTDKTLTQLKAKKPSFTIDLLQYPDSAANLHIHQMKQSARGHVDRLVPNNFEATKQDLARLPGLNKVPTPRGIAAIPGTATPQPAVPLDKAKRPTPRSATKATTVPCRACLSETTVSDDLEVKSAQTECSSLSDEQLQDTKVTVPKQFEPESYSLAPPTQVGFGATPTITTKHHQQQLKHSSHHPRRPVESKESRLLRKVKVKLGRLKELHEIQTVNQAQARKQAASKFQRVQQVDKDLLLGVQDRLQRQPRIRTLYGYCSGSAEAHAQVDELETLIRLLKSLERHVERKGKEFVREQDEWEDRSEETKGVNERVESLIQQAKNMLHQHTEEANGQSTKTHDTKALSGLLKCLEEEVEQQEKIQLRQGLFSQNCHHQMIMI